MTDFGWIKIHRKITENWIWSADKKASFVQAWIDMILMANYKDLEEYDSGKVITIKKGSFHTTEVGLARRWNWSRDKVDTFLDALQEQNMINRIKIRNKGTYITIVNYCDYQDGTNNESYITSDKSLDIKTDKTLDISVDKTNYKTLDMSKEYKEIKERKEIKNNKPPISPFEELEKTDLTENIKVCLREWFEYKKQRKEKSYQTEMGFKKFITQVRGAVSDHGEEKVIKQFDYAMSRGWSGAYLDKIQGEAKSKPDNDFTLEDILKQLGEDGE